MRIIANHIIDAICKREKLAEQNTLVLQNGDECLVRDRGSLIFVYNYNTKNAFAQDCNWPSKSTARRINTCLEAYRRLTGNWAEYKIVKKVGVFSGAKLCKTYEETKAA